VISFTIYGKPRPKGSVEPVWMPGGKAKVRHRNESWQTLVALAAQPHAPADGLLEGPVSTVLRVCLARPVSAPKRRRTWPVTRSGLDVDKAARAALDALTGVIWRDDSQVTELHIYKGWADDGRPRLEIEVDRPADYAQWHAGRMDAPQPRELPGLQKGVPPDGR